MFEKEAEEYAHKSMAWCEDFDFTYKIAEEKIKQAYLAGAEPREKQIAELEAQIEKMKRCSICKYPSNLGYCKIRCNGGECNKMDKWELAD